MLTYLLISCIVPHSKSSWLMQDVAKLDLERDERLAWLPHS